MKDFFETLKKIEKLVQYNYALIQKIESENLQREMIGGSILMETFKCAFEEQWG